MNKLTKVVFGFVGLLILATLLKKNLHLGPMVILHPKGLIGSQERDLMLTATALMLIVVIPVFALLAGILWRYRATNKKAVYTPDWDHSAVLESIWWGLPFAIIVMLSIITWNSSHNLDPARALSPGTKPLRVQVVALPWKWLFIYPDQNIASVNYLQFPKATPINFEITADAPMNSFWIPQLGGQIYAMAGMKTQLHLIADQEGVFNGSSANISGRGFAGMKFLAHSSSQSAFNDWVKDARQTGQVLSMGNYGKLAQPSVDVKPQLYKDPASDLYDMIVMKYMGPTSDNSATPYKGHH